MKKRKREAARIGEEMLAVQEDLLGLSRLARETARAAWKRGDKVKHSKFSAVARVYSMSAAAVRHGLKRAEMDEAIDPPF